MQISEYDAYLFHEGTNYEIYQKMGAHPCSEDRKEQDSSFGRQMRKASAL